MLDDAGKAVGDGPMHVPVFRGGGLPEREIAAALNERGIMTDLGRPWTRGSVHQVLINEKYVGNNVWNRVSFKLKKKRVRNRPDIWIRAEGAFEPIVDRALFERAPHERLEA